MNSNEREPVDQPAIESRRLILEPLVREHAALTFSLWQDERLYTFIPFERPAGLAGLEERYGMLARRRSPDGSEQWLNWFARKKSDGEYVGLVQVTIRLDSSAYLAYFTFAAHLRSGFAYESCRATIEFLVANRGVEEFVAEIDTRNVASIRLIEKLGFHRASYTPEAGLIRGAPSDEYCYVLKIRRAPDA